MLPKDIYSVFWTDMDFRKDDIILTVLKKTLSYEKPFIVDKMFLDGETRNRFVKFNFSKDRERIIKAINTYEHLKFGFMREENDFFHLNFGRRSFDGTNKYGRTADPNTCSVQIEKHLFQSNNNVEKYICLVKSIYNLTRPYYGYAHDGKDNSNIRRENDWLKIYHTPKFCMIYWMNFFGPTVVENYGGKAKFLNAPCWKVEELEDGGILLLLYPDPLEPEKDEKRKIHNAVLEHFGLERI